MRHKSETCYLLIKDFDEALKREAKACAARKGLLLKRFIEQAVRVACGMPEPTEDHAARVREE